MILDRKALLLDPLDEGSEQNIAFLVNVNLLILEDCLRLWILFVFESHLDPEQWACLVESLSSLLVVDPCLRLVLHAPTEVHGRSKSLRVVHSTGVFH